MSLIAVIYLADIVCLLKFIAVASSMLSFFAACVFAARKEEFVRDNGEKKYGEVKDYSYEIKLFHNRYIISLTMFILILPIAILTPSKEAIYMMAGAKSVQTVYDSPEAKEIGTKIMSIVNKKLDEQLKEK